MDHIRQQASHNSVFLDLQLLRCYDYFTALFVDHILQRSRLVKERVYFGDNYKGILILLVVFGHFIYSYANNLSGSFVQNIYIFIYSFHMPAFIFCSGYFSKSERSRSKESLTKLFLYYVFFNTLMLVFTHFYMGSSIKLLTPYYSYWYILSLIFWRALAGKLSNVKGIVILSVAVSMLLGYSKEFTNLLSLRRTVAFFPFFIAGYLLDRQKAEDFLAKRKPWHMVASGVLVVIVAAVSFWAVKHFELTSSATLMNSYSKKSTIAHRILIFSISSAAIAGMLLTVPNRNIPLLSKIGKNSLLIYLVHRFITIIYYRTLFPSKTYSSIYLLYALIATILVCVLFSSDRMNQWFSSSIDRAAAALNHKESELGRCLIIFIILLFIGVLLLNIPT